MELVEEILKWPVIIQGALGSFLFWFILWAGQKSVNFASTKVSEEKETAIYFAKTFAESEIGSDIQDRSFQNSMYGALHYFVKSILVIVMSMLLGYLLPVFKLVGFLIAAYFLFRSLSYVPHFDSFEK
ncbi:hypothetical protein [Marinomonas foliarum]|uniref:Uncharacterized protein n=1 Tax=Marinomonas foliarum TaxID=491950 RepID=A0A368ZM79_9GAMM|nr:hypothetical protein [Marinomonas foliarum]RCW95831.1 hypothetical protein DFP77_13749 [Marinomonas foliarum]